MSKVPRIGDLEIDQDLTFQRQEWRAERVGWVLMGLFVLLALLGLLGGGPLSWADEGLEDGSLRVEYERFLRLRAPARVTFRLDSAPSGGEIRLWLSADYLRDVQIQRVMPQPVRVEVGADRHLFYFRPERPGEPVRVVIHFEPESVGRLRGQAGLAGGAALAFGQFVYP